MRNWHRIGHLTSRRIRESVTDSDPVSKQELATNRSKKTAVLIRRVGRILFSKSQCRALWLDRSNKARAATRSHDSADDPPVRYTTTGEDATIANATSWIMKYIRICYV